MTLTMSGRNGTRKTSPFERNVRDAGGNKVEHHTPNSAHLAELIHQVAFRGQLTGIHDSCRRRDSLKSNGPRRRLTSFVLQGHSQSCNSAAAENTLIAKQNGIFEGAAFSLPQSTLCQPTSR
jgi:hypothetical protein